MRIALAVPLLLFAPPNPLGRTCPQHSSLSEHESAMEEIDELSRLADQSHTNGDITREIWYRRRLSQQVWANFARDQKAKTSGTSVKLFRFSRWDLVHTNDLPLGLLLEGTNNWPEAEAIYRHNRSELAHERLAGNDIKAENQLHMAHLLAREGKNSEAKAICSHWKNRVKHNSDFALFAAKYNVPTPPLYDTPEVEIAAWNLACGLPEEGLSLLSRQIEAHPKMLISFSVLSHYYFSEGDFEKARRAETDGTLALTGH